MEGVEYDREAGLRDDLVRGEAGGVSLGRRDQAARTLADPSWPEISPWRRGLGASKGK